MPSIKGGPNHIESISTMAAIQVDLQINKELQKSLCVLESTQNYVIRTTRNQIRYLRQSKFVKFQRLLPLNRINPFKTARWFLVIDESELTEEVKTKLSCLSNHRGNTILHIIAV